MDVDVPTGSPKLGEENPLEQYGHVLEELSESPYDYGKHQEHLQLAHQLGPDAVYEARDLLARFFPLSSGKEGRSLPDS